jgi:hypothetical protein
MCSFLSLSPSFPPSLLPSFPHSFSFLPLTPTDILKLGNETVTDQQISTGEWRHYELSNVITLDVEFLISSDRGKGEGREEGRGIGEVAGEEEGRDKEARGGREEKWTGEWRHY